MNETEIDFLKTHFKYKKVWAVIYTQDGWETGYVTGLTLTQA
jgi:hypothetical protein